MKKIKPLTKKQSVIYSFLVDYIEEFGHPPTLQEIADKMKIKVPTAWQYLDTMKKKKAITRDYYRWNSISLNL